MPVAEAPRSDGLKVNRIYSVVPPLEPVWWMLRTQQEFVNEITDAGECLSENVRTGVLNDGLDGPSVLLADTQNRYTRPDARLGTVRPQLGETNGTIFTTALLGLHHPPQPGTPAPTFTLDSALGTDTDSSGFTPGVDNTADGGITNVDLEYQTDYAQDLCDDRNIQADSFQATMQPFAIEAWVKMPDRDADGNDVSIQAGDPAQLLVDIGDGQSADTAVDQARLYLEYAAGDRLRLKFRMDDEAGLGYVVASSSDNFTFAPGCWYHVTVAAVGTFRGEMAMVIDGIYDKNMLWEFDHGGTSDDDAAVQGSYFWPVALPVPNKQYKVDIGPGVNSEWVAGSLTLRLTDVLDLPPRGMVVVHNRGAGLDESHTYEYSAIVGTDLTLVTPLAVAAYPGDNVACMVPLVQTTVHQDAPALTASPQAGDQVRFYEHSRLNPTPHPQGFDAWGYPTGSAAPVYHDATVLDVGTMTDPADAPASRLSKFTWVAFDPDDYTQGATSDRLFDPDAGTVEPYVGESGFFDPTARRWKVLNAAADTLSGEMPCYPGATFRIGGSAAGGEQFTGELDEVRLSVLPVAMPYTGLLTAAADWSAGPNLNVDTWAWDQDLGGGILGPGLIADARLDLADETPTRKVFDGGYFAIEGDLYDFNTFAGAILGGVEQQYADLTSTGTAGPAQTHELLKRLIPLNCITSTRLAGAILDTTTSITLADVNDLPADGYVKVDDEVLAYNAIAGNAIELTDPAFRRGCYNTVAAGHNAATTVRLLPLRELDRYRSTTRRLPGIRHIAYGGTVVSDATNMSMLSWTVPSTAGDEVSNVSWTLKDPLEAGQKVAVLVSLDTSLDWGIDPLVGNGANGDWFSTDNLWGTLLSTPGIDPPNYSMQLFDSTGAHPLGHHFRGDAHLLRPERLERIQPHIRRCHGHRHRRAAQAAGAGLRRPATGAQSGNVLTQEDADTMRAALRRIRAPGGFTLVEMLVAIAITLIFGVMAATTLSAGAGMWRNGHRRSYAYDTATVIFQQIQDDLGAAKNQFWGTEADAYDTRIKFWADLDALHRMRQLRQPRPPLDAVRARHPGLQRQPPHPRRRQRLDDDGDGTADEEVYNLGRRQRQATDLMPLEGMCEVAYMMGLGNDGLRLHRPGHALPRRPGPHRPRHRHRRRLPA